MNHYPEESLRGSGIFMLMTIPFRCVARQQREMPLFFSYSLAISAQLCYALCKALPVCSGQPSHRRAASPSVLSKGGLPMVTYSDLIQVGILIVGILGLYFQAKKK